VAALSESNNFGEGVAHGAPGHSDVDGIPLPGLAVWGNLAIYIVAWALLMWPQHLPLGRPGIAVVFAALACGLRAVCTVAWPSEQYPPVAVFEKIEVTPLALLLGLMLVNAYLKDTGVWEHVERVLDSASPRKMLVKICIVSAAMSAILLNDTTCFVLTPVVLNLCAKHQARSTMPFLLALSTSSNIGSSLTIIGNPQNALIAVICTSITFMGFVRAMLAPVCVGLALNTGALLVHYHKTIVFDKPAVLDTPAAAAAADVLSDTMAGIDLECSSERSLTPRAGPQWVAYLAAVAGVIGVMLAGWLSGLATDQVAVGAGAMLMLARAMRRRIAGSRSTITETEFALVKGVDYTILMLFAGQFVLVGATVDTGLPQTIFRAVLGPCAENLNASAGCMLWFSGLVMILSNIIGNVPVILMLEPLLASQPAHSARDVWIVCAWVATVAGNLTMLGSAANLIVAHAAESLGEHSFTATRMAKFSVLPTIATTAVGLAFLPPVGSEMASTAVFVASICLCVVLAAHSNRAALLSLLAPRAKGTDDTGPSASAGGSPGGRSPTKPVEDTVSSSPSTHTPGGVESLREA